jgi:RNA polymerase sigma-70 factor (ECF subfamily)
MGQGKQAEWERTFLSAYEENADALFRYCMMRVRNRELATDIVQETFTRTWSYLAEGKKIEHLRAFLYRTLYNLIVDTMRKKRSVSLDEMQDEDGFEPVDDMPQGPDAATREEVKAAMRLLSSLDDMYAQAVTLRYVESLTPREIADILNVSENVVSVRIHRGLAQLRELWKTKHE